MPTTTELINTEQLGNMLFLISTFYSIESGNKASQSELEKQQGTSGSESTSTSQGASKLAWLSTWYSVAGYVFFIVAAMARKKNLEQDIQAGTTTVSIVPSIIIIVGFIISAIGTIMRLPAIQQRIAEAQIPVVL